MSDGQYQTLRRLEGGGNKKDADDYRADLAKTARWMAKSAADQSAASNASRIRTAGRE